MRSGADIARIGEDGAASNSKSEAAWEGAGEGKPVEKCTVEVGGLTDGVGVEFDVDANVGDVGARICWG